MIGREGTISIVNQRILVASAHSTITPYTERTSTNFLSILALIISWEVYLLHGSEIVVKHVFKDSILVGKCSSGFIATFRKTRTYTGFVLKRHSDHFHDLELSCSHARLFSRCPLSSMRVCCLLKQEQQSIRR